MKIKNKKYNIFDKYDIDVQGFILYGCIWAIYFIGIFIIEILLKDGFI